MDVLTFCLRCRTCHETNPLPWAYNLDARQDGQPMEDYFDVGLMQVVELLNQQQGVRCPFCGAMELEVLDLALDGQPVFDYADLCQRCDEYGLDVLAVTIEPVAGQLGVHLATHPPQVPTAFALLALDSLVALVAGRPDHDFGPDASERFYGCVAGHWAADVQQQLVLPQRYTCRGLHRDEVLSALRSMRSQLAAQ